MSSAAQKHILIRHEPVRIRRKIVSAAVAVCAKELAPFHVTRKYDADAVWRIVSQVAAWDDIYRLAWTLDYYAFECTTGFMDLALKLRRALNAHWLSETRLKIQKEVCDGRRVPDPAGAGRSSKGKRLAKDAKRR